MKTQEAYRLVVAYGLSAMLMLFAWAPIVAQETTVVYPNQFADVEGNTGDDGTFVWQNGTRVQAVFFASEFAVLPETHQLITAYRWRPDGFTVTEPQTRTWPHLSLRLSTTQLNSLDDLSETFADNVGADETLVYDGPVTWSTQNIGPLGGPKEFDYELKFDTPFAYDPTQGNLLVDWTTQGPLQDIGYDAHRADNLGIGVFAANAASATGGTSASRAGIFEFVFVPEPSSALLGLMALGSLLMFRRR